MKSIPSWFLIITRSRENFNLIALNLTGPHFALLLPICNLHFRFLFTNEQSKWCTTPHKQFGQVFQISGDIGTPLNPSKKRLAYDRYIHQHVAEKTSLGRLISCLKVLIELRRENWVKEPSYIKLEPRKKVWSFTLS